MSTCQPLKCFPFGATYSHFGKVNSLSNSIAGLVIVPVPPLELYLIFNWNTNASIASLMAFAIASTSSCSVIFLPGATALIAAVTFVKSS